MSEIEWEECADKTVDETGETDTFRPLPFCPLLEYTCRADCAWFHKTLRRCAVVLTASAMRRE